MKQKSKKRYFEIVVWIVERGFRGESNPADNVIKYFLIAKINGWAIVKSARVSGSTVRAYPESDCYTRREDALAAAEREQRKLGL